MCALFFYRSPQLLRAAEIRTLDSAGRAKKRRKLGGHVSAAAEAAAVAVSLQIADPFANTEETIAALSGGWMGGSPWSCTGYGSRKLYWVVLMPHLRVGLQC